MAISKYSIFRYFTQRKMSNFNIKVFCINPHNQKKNDVVYTWRSKVKPGSENTFPVDLFKILQNKRLWGRLYFLLFEWGKKCFYPKMYKIYILYYYIYWIQFTLNNAIKHNAIDMNNVKYSLKKNLELSGCDTSWETRRAARRVSGVWALPCREWGSNSETMKGRTVIQFD